MTARKPPWRKTDRPGLVLRYDRKLVQWMCTDHSSGCRIGTTARFWRGWASHHGLCFKCARKRGLGMRT